MKPNSLPPLPRLTLALCLWAALLLSVQAQAAPTAQVTTLAGGGVTTTNGGFADGSGQTVLFNSPQGVAVDAAGNVYVPDSSNQRIRKITPAGVVSTLAGSGSAGFVNSTNTAAWFREPHGVAVDAAGNVYVADSNNHMIRKITPAGLVTTLAGSGTNGFADGTGAEFNQPQGVAVDAAGNVYVADQDNHRIRKITPAGFVTTLAGSGTLGFADGTGIGAQFNQPHGVAVDAAGNVYVADTGNHLIRKITSTGVVTTLAGSSQSLTDGTGTAAQFSYPYGVAVDAATNVYVADSSNHAIRKITPAGVVTTLAGFGAGFMNGIATAAQFNAPTGVAVDAEGNVYVSDANNNQIRKISPTVPPVINSPPTAAATVGQVFTYQITASGTPTNFTAGGQPAWLFLTPGTGILSGTPTAAGTFNITLGATGAGGTGTGTLAITVSPVGGGVPVITSPTTAATTVGQVFTYQIIASGTPVSYTATGLPAGLALDPTTGLISGTPTAAGTVSVTLGAVSAAGTGTLLVTLTVNPPATVQVTTLAGNNFGFADGPGTSARFAYPQGVAVDAAGNVYVADTYNHLIRKITPAGVVTTLAGSTAGFADGFGTAARFSSPNSVAVDAAGNVYVADQDNNRIRKITPAGLVTTLAGSTAGFADGFGTAARFYFPTGVAVDAQGNVYVADQDNHRIRKITPTGLVTTLAGSGTEGFADGFGTAARFYYPQDVAVDAAGNVYVADTYNNRIRKITPTGLVTTLAGSGIEGFADGPPTSARFAYPQGVAVDTAGNVYVGDYYNHLIRMISPAGVVTTLAGSTGGFADGAVTAAQFSYPQGVAVDAARNVYVADRYNHRIRKIGSTGVVPVNSAPTITSQPLGLTVAVGSIVRFSVSAAGHGPLAYQWWFGTDVVPSGTNAFLVLGNVQLNQSGDYTVVITNAYGSATSSVALLTVNQLQASSVQVTTLAGNNFGFADGTGTNAQFSAPNSVAVDAARNVYVADRNNHRIRMITSAGVVTTLAGSGTLGSANGPGKAARFDNPMGVAVDGAGNVYVADFGNHRIRKITPAGVVTTLAGSSQGFADGTGTAAQFNFPTGVAVDAQGNVYVGEQFNGRIRKITPAGVVTTLAGSGQGFADGFGTAARFYYPQGVAVDEFGNVYVADTYNHRIRKITPAGFVTTLAGSGTLGFADGTGIGAQFNYPTGVAVDAFGNVYVADPSNQVIRKITPAGLVTTLAGSTAGFADGISTDAQFYTPTGVAVDAQGEVYVADQYNNRIRKITPAVPPVINNSPTAAATVGLPFTYQIAAAGLPKIYAATGLPAGLSLTPDTGVISGTPAESGTFGVTLAAGNSFGTDTRALALTVAPLAFTQVPQGLVVVAGATATFTVGVTGLGPFTYQWRFYGVNIPEANRSRLTLTNVQVWDAGAYSVVVVNAYGNMPSPVAVLSVPLPPSITRQPVGSTNVAGDTVSFTVEAAGSAPLTYEWRFNGVRVPDAVSSTLTLGSVSVTVAGTYSVIVSNAVGVAISSNLLLAVNSPPVITTHPGARVVNATAPVSFSVGVLGEESFTYQWRFNGTNLPGATGVTYSSAAAAPSHEGLYSVVVSNARGSATSSAARLTVLPVSVVVPWAAGSGGSGADVGNAIAVDAAGNSYVAGYFNGTATFGTNTLTSAGLTDIFITKQDSSGQLLWARRAGGPGYDVAKGIAVDALGNCYVTGAYEGVAVFGTNSLSNTSPTSYSDVFLAKYDAAGTPVWVRSAGVEFVDDEGAAVAVDSAGNVLVTGRSGLGTFAGVPVANTGRIFVAKYTGAGAEVWARKAGSYSGGSQDTGTGLAADSSGNVFMGGVFYSPAATFGTNTFTNYGNADMFLVKFDAAGTLQWARQAGGAGEDTAGGVAVATNGSAYLVGAVGGNANFSGSNVMSLAGAASDGFIVKYAGDGSVTWVRQFGGNGLSAARAVAVDVAGTVHVTGYFSGGATFGTTTIGGLSGSYDAFLTRLDASGVFAFAQQAGGADLSGDFGLGVGADTNGNSFITGYFNGTSSVGGGSLPSRGAEDVLVTRFNQFTGGGVPTLSLQRNGAQFRMRWPLASSSYILQSTTNLLVPAWRDETNALTLTGSELETDVTPGSAVRFYRLHKP